MKVLEKYYNEIFDFKGQWNMPSKCGLKIINHDNKTIIIVTELYQANPGTSVTYAGLTLAKQICETKGLDLKEVIYIECNPDTKSKLSFYDEELFMVMFYADEELLARPEYRKLSAEEVHQLGILDMPDTHRAGFVNIIGNPNAGKSTLMNRLVGERLSIITNKAQTTRHRIKGIVNGDDFQIVYSDLPGILTPAYKMQEMMMRFIFESLQDADLLLYLVECGETGYNEEIIGKISKLTIPVLLVLNKTDLVTPEKIEDIKILWHSILPDAEMVEISALHNYNIEVLQQKIVELLPFSPPFFPKDELTDRPTRFFISEIIREKLLLLYKKEIPYSVEVVIESFKDEGDIVRIGAMLYVERDTQKGIIIGSKGAAIKQLGIEARTSIEAFLNKHVYLDLSVKVLKDWRNNEQIMKRFGYYDN
jgi:GTP-binding protein Era